MHPYNYPKLKDSIYVDGSSSAAGGTGTLNVEDNGLVSATNMLKIWGQGTVNLDGGTIQAGTLDPTAGDFNWVRFSELD